MYTATINTRIEPMVKKKAEGLLRKVGLTSAEAIRLFYHQICLQHGLPFEVKIPNEKTQKAMNDAETGKTIKVSSVKQIFDEI